MHLIRAKSILSAENGMNVYRGCTHGCIYCDSRSTCYGFTHAFEDVAVKENAPVLLEKALKSKRKTCMIGTGSMCDPYLPLEEEQEITRKCLEIIERYRFGLSVLTKSDRILRDLPLLKSINSHAKCVVQMTLTTFDDDLCRILEPNVCPTSRRVEVLETMRDEGIPTVVWLCPILPYINDTMENLDGILKACLRAKVRGILCFGMGVTLREGSREYFYQALDRHFPGMKERYIARYGNAYALESDRSDALLERFYGVCRREGLLCTPDEVFSYLRTYENPEEQLSLF